MATPPAPDFKDARDKLAAARVWLLRQKPFFGVLARAFRLEATLAVPGYRLTPDDRLWFNPEVVLAARFPAVCARLAHLSLHAALAAFGRRHEREPRRWNVACDLAIAPLLDAADLSVGRAPGGLGIELPPGASAEAYYAALPDGVAPDPLWCDLCDPEQATGYGPQATAGEEDGASGAPSSLKPEARSLKPAAAAAAELQWKLRLAAAYEEEIAQGGPTFGEVPGWLDELLRATIEPPADWSALLQQAIHQLQRTDRSYLRPSRRMAALVAADGAWPDVVTMPGRRIAHAGRLCCVVDTSASLPTGTLARFFGAVVAAATAEGIDELRLLQADAAVTRDETVFAAELLFRAVEVAGRGGTDFAPALALLAADARRSGERFTVAYLTDLDGRFPATAAADPLDVLWIVPRKTTRSPPFGRILEMS